MTDEEFLRLCQKTHAAVQDENGIDVTQIDHLLSLSPTDRLRTLEEFLEEMDALKATGEKWDAEATRTSRTIARGGR
ncbi:MAG: hypothetical protein WBD40_15010 [Tepidisphaeraceae bacterium]